MKRYLFSAALLVAVASSAFAQTAQSEIDRFVDFYGAEVERTGEKPDHTSTRESRIAFLQRTVKSFCSPLLAMKRASETRPISDEVVVFVGLGPEYRVFADFIPNGGSSNWSLSKHLEGRLPIEQPLVDPLTLGRLPEASFAPTVPGCKPPSTSPAPPPAPTPPMYPPYPSNEADVDGAGLALFSDFSAAGQDLNAQMFRFAFRVAYSWLTKEVADLPASVAKHRKEWRALLGLP